LRDAIAFQYIIKNQDEARGQVSQPEEVFEVSDLNVADNVDIRSLHHRAELCRRHDEQT
jgi:hypothetical protein